GRADRGPPRGAAALDREAPRLRRARRRARAGRCAPGGGVVTRILGLVPARGGSTGIPRKNVRPLLGKPLLAWTAECACAARSLARVVLSTDDEEIAEVGRTWGLEVPFL